jgi:hypothetical protein
MFRQKKRSSHHSLPDHVRGVVAAPLQVLWQERVVQMEPKCTPLGEGHVCNGPSHTRSVACPVDIVQ